MSTSSADNKAIVLRLIEEVLSKGNLSVADELLDVNFVLHLPGSSEPLRGVEGLKRAAEVFRSGFPDRRFLVEDVISEGDKVAVRAVQQHTSGGISRHQPDWQASERYCNCNLSSRQRQNCGRVAKQ